MAGKNTGARGSARSLVERQLEFVVKEVFVLHYPLVTELIGESPGIYALYSDKDLYYVGKSIDLRKRVKDHLKDRHLASWTHFSLYLVRNADHIHDIESLLIRIASPTGTRAVPKVQASGQLANQLRRMIKAEQDRTRKAMFPSLQTVQKAERRPSSGRAQSLVGLVQKTTKLYRTYKGQEYQASLNPQGIITFNAEKYTSPSGAAKAVVGAQAVNGWRFLHKWHGDDRVEIGFGEQCGGVGRGLRQQVSLQQGCAAERQ